MAYLENGVLRARPRRYFSQRLHRWSLLVQHPTLTTWRELVCLVLFLYALYEAVLAAAGLRELLWRSDVHRICPYRRSGVECLKAYLYFGALELLWRVGNVVIWVPIAVLAIFVGEEFVFGRGARRR